MKAMHAKAAALGLGGLVAVGLFTALMACVAPLAALASHLGARRALRAARPGQAP